MAAIVRVICLGLALSTLVVAVAEDPVRRTNIKHSPSQMHCVVWGDGPYFGKKFDNENDAGQQFERVKRDELVAIHYDNRFREVQRFKSPRIRSGFNWHHLGEWCKEDHESEAEPATLKLEIGVGATGTVSEELMQRPTQASLIAVDSEAPPALAVRTSSNLVGKVGVIEEELTQLASKASGLLESLGVKNYVGALSLGGKDRSKLKARVAASENFLAGMNDNMRLLEEEFLGAATTSVATLPKDAVSVKAKVQSMEVEVDNMKKRLLALDTSHIIAGFPKLEEQITSYSSKIVSMFKNLGYPDGAAKDFKIQEGATFKQRMSSVSEAIVVAQRSTKTLGSEMLDHTWTSLATSQDVKATGLKPQIESLESLVEDLHHRVSELESAPLNGNVDKAEKKLSLLQAKASELSKRIGSEAPLSMLEATHDSDTSLKARILRLEKTASMAESKFGSLETELLGGAKATSKSPTSTESMMSRVKALDLQVDGLASRAAALEQEV